MTSTWFSRYIVLEDVHVYTMHDRANFGVAWSEHAATDFLRISCFRQCLRCSECRVALLLLFSCFPALINFNHLCSSGFRESYLFIVCHKISSQGRCNMPATCLHRPIEEPKALSNTASAFSSVSNSLEEAFVTYGPAVMIHERGRWLKSSL